MSAQRQIHHEFTPAEYLQYEENSPTKHEFYQGQIFAMAGTSSDHNRIAGDSFAALSGQLRGQPCEAFIGDQRIKVEATSLQTYPDVLVACPPLAYDPNDKHTLVDATVIIEVLSRSTASYDRNAKFDNYKRLHSLRHYVLIEQKQIEVTHHFLSAAGDWQGEVFESLDDVVSLNAIECQLELREVYRRINFDAS